MFKIGQKVICINDNYSGAYNKDKHSRLPVLNEILTINGYGMVGQSSLTFREINTEYGYGFLADRFRPLLSKEDLSETTYEDIMEIFLVPKSL